MLITHSVDGDMLHVTLHRHLDIAVRAAATQEIEALVLAHRPCRVTLRVPAGEPTPATLSTVLRAHRMCGNLGIPLVLAGASTATRRLLAAKPA
ncbi:hypothetical protein [Streptomyces heilongjiangensis]|uniref:STAS domain-containing protein n=1 Tax=Streptomyces heilongjiangensis TaxID=945052 RepID=A0ABW1AZY5_9ACTN|nr:hypothetical protein [Streptomyces heilongjiangensis]MDC2946517.1 hypothetical protein [Streptomyces heilongjiangensis]